MTLSLIIPVKNEEEIILNTLNQLENSWLTDIEHEILIINDNSEIAISIGINVIILLIEYLNIFSHFCL